ncbi:MAG: NADP-dependent malic enzyme [Proteobacteria bacterium]|nr:NADP-dependent malic enzyme [Pseudomonadota bacterium]
MLITSTHNQRTTLISIHFSQEGDASAKVEATLRELAGKVSIIDRLQNRTHITLFLKSSEDQAPLIINKLNSLEDVGCAALDPTFAYHLAGKIGIRSKINVTNREELALAYTPEVAKVCLAIHHNPEQADTFTLRQNCVAVISDGTAVLGLGNIGPKAAMPVMEGKALLFKEFAGIDAIPLCLATSTIDDFIRTVTYIAPNFGGINLEDIAAPGCFEIEKRLKANLDIPVFHDDQHGTAVAVAAAFINTLKITEKKPENLKVVICGVGAAGTACKNMLQHLGVINIIGCDRKGALSLNRNDLDFSKREFAETTNPQNLTGDLATIIKGADLFIGLSGPNLLTVQDLKNMNKDPVVFAMANPTPEILPEIAAPYVAIMATGRSDYPNQINNLLAFPGIFRGALDCRASDINLEMQIAAAYAIADTVDESVLSPEHIVPSVFDKIVVPAVASAVIRAAQQTGVARK